VGWVYWEICGKSLSPRGCAEELKTTNLEYTLDSEGRVTIAAIVPNPR